MSKWKSGSRNRSENLTTYLIFLAEINLVLLELQNKILAVAI